MTLKHLAGKSLMGMTTKQSAMRGLYLRLFEVFNSLLTSELTVDFFAKSGRKIVSILEKNPDKDPNKYDSEDIQHMRKVVSYCKRHLAQEETAKKDTSSKSYKSLKNWGHDPLKT